ncbi:unconventional myosin-VI-like [Saccopteryx bilineata]|uniref:unconventional myosin-VI-like n=1 Tax=Saccopteryx bilineata TaxID=59482 RepID=UPI00338F3C5F
MGYMFFTQEETARGQKLQHELQTERQKRLELERALEKELRVRELQFTLEAERLHRQLLEKQLRIQELESQLLAKSQQPQEPKRSPKEQQHPCRWIGFESAGAGACDSSSEDEKAQAEAAIRTLRARPVVAKKVKTQQQRVPQGQPQPPAQNWSKQSERRLARYPGRQEQIVDERFPQEWAPMFPDRGTESEVFVRAEAPPDYTNGSD